MLELDFSGESRTGADDASALIKQDFGLCLSNTSVFVEFFLIITKKNTAEGEGNALVWSR